MTHRITLLLEYTKLSEVAAENEEKADRTDTADVRTEKLMEKKPETSGKGKTSERSAAAPDR